MAWEDPTAARQMNSWNQSWQNDGRCRAVFYKRFDVLDERATHGYTEERDVINDDGSVRIEKKRFPGAGRPIFREAIFIRKFTPGDATNIPDREKWPHDEEEFPREWAAFLEGDKGGVSGTPLEMLPGLSGARVEEFKAYPKAPIRTIEELANLSDQQAQIFMCHAEREKARSWLLAFEKQAPVIEMQNQLAERDAAIAELRAEMNRMKEAMGPQAVPPTIRRKPGPKPKVQADPET